MIYDSWFCRFLRFYEGMRSAMPADMLKDQMRSRVLWSLAEAFERALGALEEVSVISNLS